VKNVSLAIALGSQTMIVGRSGSGKSLTLRALMGLLPVKAWRVSGDVVFDGQRFDASRPESLAGQRGAGMAMIFQDPATHLDPLMTVGGHLAEMVGPRPAAARELLAQVRLTDPDRMLAARPHELSGGQKQRVMIALALASRPQLLLADEPTSALDATVQREIMDLLDELRRDRGLTILMVTHDMSMALAVSDRVCVMSDGEIVDTFDPAAIDTHTACAATRELLEGTSRISVRPTQKPVGAPVVLRTECLTKTWNNTKPPALAPISIAVRRGTILAIVGESGSGKTTLGRLVVGLARASGGSVRVGAGETTDHLRIRRVQMVFQDPATALDPDRTVGALLTETMKVNGIGADLTARFREAADLLARVGLPVTTLDRRPTQLSGGERQRVAIARALAPRPEILICDEIVSALDVHLRSGMLELLADLRTSLELTILFITHDLDLAEHFADEVAVLEGGHLVEIGPVNTVFGEPTSPYTRKLIASRYPLPPAM
jgi:peptide/nickel transport system ATP-binding protein